MDMTQLDPTLQQLQSQLDAVFQPFQAEVTAYTDEPILYHYTDDQGLKGILENGTLWLSDAFSMNDPSEIRYGLRFGTDRVNTLINTALPEHVFFASVFNDFIDTGASQSGHYSICCFGRADPNEDLGQWRAYADDGRGFALAFDTHALSTAFMNNGYQCPGTFPVSYKEQRLTNMQHAVAAHVVPLISYPVAQGFSRPETQAYLVTLSTMASVKMLEIALYFKHTAYQHEQEYRFLTVHSAAAGLPGGRQRMRKYELVNYIEFNWTALARDSLTKIILGPAADHRVARKFAEDCLRTYGFNQNLTIEACSIPYRTFGG